MGIVELIDLKPGANDRYVPIEQISEDLKFRLNALREAHSGVLSLRRFLHLCRHDRFAPSFFPVDPRIARGLVSLRVHDALQDGASHRDIAAALFGAHRIALEWRGASESLRSRIRRFVRDARWLATGGYRTLLRGRQY